MQQNNGDGGLGSDIRLDKRNNGENGGQKWLHEEGDNNHY